jgi:hypothetical protein
LSSIIRGVLENFAGCDDWFTAKVATDADAAPLPRLALHDNVKTLYNLA